jgi:hypothetical protein
MTTPLPLPVLSTIDMYVMHGVTGVTTIITLIVAIKGLRKVEAKVAAAQTQIAEIHLSINSRMDEFLAAARQAGRQDERDAHSVTVPGVPANEPE